MSLARPGPLARALALGLALGLALAGCGHRQPKDSALGQDAESSPGDVYVELAAEYLRLGQMDAALRRAEQGIAEDAKNPRAHYVMAVVLQRLGQMDRADESYRQALELSPNNPDILHAYGSFHCSQGRYAEAEAQFAKALESPLYSAPWATMTNAGTCAAMAGNRTKAETDYRRALAANPRYGPALIKMAELEFNRGNAKETKGYLDRFFQTNVPTPGALALAVRTERKLGNRKAAEAYLLVLQKNFPGTRETLEL
jgi:type IV pilus assembly protein PilF